jgi:multisubunit Na+/H+ antiporter MnhG subunit
MSYQDLKMVRMFESLGLAAGVAITVVIAVNSFRNGNFIVKALSALWLAIVLAAVAAEAMAKSVMDEEDRNQLNDIQKRIGERIANKLLGYYPPEVSSEEPEGEPGTEVELEDFLSWPAPVEGDPTDIFYSIFGDLQGSNPSTYLDEEEEEGESPASEVLDESY